MSDRFCGSDIQQTAMQQEGGYSVGFMRLKLEP